MYGTTVCVGQGGAGWPLQMKAARIHRNFIKIKLKEGFVIIGFMRMAHGESVPVQTTEAVSRYKGYKVRSRQNWDSREEKRERRLNTGTLQHGERVQRKLHQVYIPCGLTEEIPDRG